MTKEFLKVLQGILMLLDNFDVVCSSIWLERLLVVQNVAGSSPVLHPKFKQ